MWATVGLLALSGKGAVGQVVINEIMYNPHTSKGSEANAEFVELFNAGTSVADVSGYTFREGDGTTWSESSAFGSISIPAGGFLIIANAGSEADFRNLYADVPDKTPFVIFEMGLLNTPNGTTTEQLELRDSGSSRVDWVLYDDASPWPNVSDGYSLELMTADVSLNDQGGNWAASLVRDGTPGRVNSVVPEPATAALFGVGVGGILCRWRKRGRRQANGKDS